MLKKLAASLAVVVVFGAAGAAYAGGAYCSGHSSASASAWSGAWLERTATGAITVADVAPRSAAARAGLRAGDVVTAVNGHKLGEESCSPGSCSVGNAVTYTVQRGRDVRTVKFKLEKMPANASQRYAHREASFDRTLAAVVMPAAH